MRSVGQILDANRGHGPGFDTLRVALSIAVLSWHSIAICYGPEVLLAVYRGPIGLLSITMLPAFFALSGFLVMGSALRLGSLRHFMANRALRIVPALTTEVTLSALVVGPLVSVLPAREYFSSPLLFSYFGSLFGRVQFILPGVFEHNPLPEWINSNLWTIPPEILCYLFMAMMMVSGIYKSRALVICGAAGVVLLNALQDNAQHWGMPEGSLPARYLVMCFAYGIALFMWRHRLPYIWAGFALSLIVGLAFLRTPGLIYLSLLAISYCTVFLGVTKLPKGWLFSGGDYSYGIYLYGAPIQQTIAYLFPATREFYWNILICLPLTILVAIVSWHLVEKRALDLRARISSKDEWLIDSFVGRFCIGVVIVAYAILLIRFSAIRFTGAIDIKMVASIAIIIVSGSLAAAAIPMLHYGKVMPSR